MIRITRDGQLNHACQVPSSEIRRLWSDPMLRNSRLLDGLFYRVVVLCEGDSDCRFYASVLQENQQEICPGLNPADVLFVPVGGTGHLVAPWNALRAVGVPVRIAVDFDVMRDETLLSTLITAAGGDWDPVKPLWQRLSAPIKSKGQAADTAAVRSDINGILDQSGPSSLQAQRRRYGSGC